MTQTDSCLWFWWPKWGWDGMGRDEIQGRESQGVDGSTARLGDIGAAPKLRAGTVRTGREKSRRRNG